jgi:hypothetical protein
VEAFNNYMKERERNQTEGVQLPPTWCSSLCRNAMNEICIESCALKRDCSAFEEKPNLSLRDMPRFPETGYMTKEEKFTSVTIYLSKVIDHLQGNEALPNNKVLHGSTHIAEVLGSLESKEQK